MNKILILYKRSAYEIYFLGIKSSVFHKEHLLGVHVINNLKQAHAMHYQSLEMIEEVLHRYHFRYHKRCRGSKIDFSMYDTVITVGGDGTFLEAARKVRRQVILGVNSDPSNSVGRFCFATALNFEKILKKILEDKIKIKEFQRLHLSLNSDDKNMELEVANDILICHQNPAALSRYYLSVEDVKEEQRSSGLWIATAAGSSGAIHSAGGKLLPEESREVQYHPRELCRGRDRKYQLVGDALILKKPITITSLIRNGMIFVDGAHFSLLFNFGSLVQISYSRYPLKIVFG